MGLAQFGPRHVVADQRGERGEQLVLVVAGAGQRQATLEVGGSRAAHAALRGALQEAALQPNGDLCAVACGARCAAGELVEGFGEESERLLECAALPRVHRCLLVSRDGIVEPLRVFEMACDHAPLGLDRRRRVDQRVGSASVQLVAQAGGRELGRHLAEQLMAESPTVSTASFEHPCAHEFDDDVVDVFGVVSDHGAKQGEITGAPDDGGRLDHRHNIGVGMMQPGE